MNSASSRQLPKQGSKRKRTANPSPPAAADRTSRPSTHIDLVGLGSQTASPAFAWPISPSPDATETARSGHTVLASSSSSSSSSYPASMPSRQGYCESPVDMIAVRRHVVQQSHDSHPVFASHCAMPVAYPQSQPCGSTNPDQDAQNFYNGTRYFYGLQHHLSGNSTAATQRLLQQVDLLPAAPVFAPETQDQGQYPDLLPQTVRPSNTQIHPVAAAVGRGVMQSPSSSHRVSSSSFQPSPFASAVEPQPGLFSTTYNPYQFMSDYASTPDANTVIKDASTPNDASLPADQATVNTVTSSQAFELPHPCAMGGGEAYLPQHCSPEGYAQFALQPGLQQIFAPALPQTNIASSVPTATAGSGAFLEVPCTEAERSSSNPLAPVQPAAQDISQVSSAQAEHHHLTEGRHRSQTGAVPDARHTSMASTKNTTHTHTHAHAHTHTKKRGPFDSQRRRETAETRKRKACLRCRVQKIRCDADQDEVEGSCLPCQGFSKVSKKTLHHVSCYRGKLTDVVLYRRGGLNLTDRWKGTEMKDIDTQERITSDTRSIQITLSICDKPIEVQVVRFRAGAGDVVARFWTVREGERGDEVRKKKDLEPFCLVSIWETADQFEKYIIDNAIATMVKQQATHRMLQKTHLGQDVIKRTYLAAIQHYLSLDDEIEGPSGKIVNSQKKLLGSLFVLWNAIRHTTGSAYICGQETLGMKPEVKDETYPLFGKVSVPRMILAQFDSINHTKLLVKYGRKVLRELETFVFRNQSTFWWPIYLTVFILLHESSITSADRYRHARNNFGGRFRYSIPSFVEELQEGCNNILVHWHYYNCHPWPNPEEPWERHRHFMSELTSEQHDLVMDTLTDPRIQKQLARWKQYRDGNGMRERPSMQPIGSQETPYMGSQTQFDWDHPCYWIAQMFEERWQPHPTYQREYSD